MGRYLKFIVTDDFDLQGGYVMFHSDILPKEKRYKSNSCLGGGFFTIDENSKEIHLYGESSDYGKCNKETLQKAIKNHGNNFKSDLWMIMYMYYRTNKINVKSDELDYTDYNIIID